jgi:hypothetical protein
VKARLPVSDIVDSGQRLLDGNGGVAPAGELVCYVLGQIIRRADFWSQAR